MVGFSAYVFGVMGKGHTDALHPLSSTLLADSKASSVTGVGF